MVLGEYIVHWNNEPPKQQQQIIPMSSLQVLQGSEKFVKSINKKKKKIK